MAKHHERIILHCFNICTFAIFDPYAFRKRSLEYEEDVVCFNDHILPGPAGSVIQKTASGAAAFSGVPFNAILLDLEMVSGRLGVVCQARCRQQLTHPERAFSLCATHNRRDCPQRSLARSVSDSGRPIGRPVDQVRVGHQRLDRADARLAVPPSLLAIADEVIE